jgi:hypothetical protein
VSAVIGVDSRLHKLAVFTLAYSDAAGLSVIETAVTDSYGWVIYVLPRMYRDIRTGRHYPGSVNSSLLVALAGGGDNRWRLTSASKGSRLLPLSKCVSTREFASLPIGQEEVDTSNYATPFLGVGSSIPPNISHEGLVACGHILSDPVLTHLVVVGDLAAAQDMLGKGLERVRAVVIEYYGLQPANSVSAEFPLPFVYSVWEKEPTVTAIGRYLSADNSRSRQGYGLAGAVTIVSTLYTILEMDHRYLDIEPLQYSKNYPSEWRITTGTSSTHIPFRWPLLVYLLGIAGCQEMGAEDSEIPELRNMLSSWGKTSVLSKLSSIYGDSSEPSPLLYDLRSLVNAYFIALYRASCKSISMPSRSEFPRRSEASRRFVEAYAMFDSQKTISAYLDLGAKLLECSFRQVPELDELAEIVGVDVYSLLTTPADKLPAVPARIGHARELSSELPKVAEYRRQLSLATGVTIECAQGRVALTELIEGSARYLIESLGDALNENRYNLFDKRNLTRLISRNASLSDGCLDEESITGALNKMHFNEPPLMNTSILGLIQWHHELPEEESIKSILQLVIEILSSVFLDSVLTGEVTKINSRDKRDISIVAAIIEAIEKDLR